MKLHVDDSRRLNAGVSAFALAVPLAAVLLLTATAPAQARDENTRPVPAANGPQADYPMVVGPPYTVGSTTYTPEDRLNYDEVGYVTADAEGGDGISGAHHTLPLPSYVEVTSLATGRTILVRMERRGPMASDHLVALSPGALSQLGATPGTPVRVRRVVPPEEQRAVLRTGQAVPPRMDTPMTLVDVLKRKLPARGSASLQAQVQDGADETRPASPAVPVLPGRLPTAIAQTSVPPSSVAPAASTPVAASTPATAPTPALPPLTPAATPPKPTAPTQAPSPAPAATPAPTATDFDKAFAPVAAAPTPAPAATPASVRAPAPVAAASSAPAPARPRPTPTPAAAPPPRPAAAPAAENFVVQAAAFSSSARAERVARVIGGTVSQSGNVYRVRTGPFPTRAAAEASLAKVQAAGYREARIFTNS